VNADDFTIEFKLHWTTNNFTT